MEMKEDDVIRLTRHLDMLLNLYGRLERKSITYMCVICGLLLAIIAIVL